MNPLSSHYSRQVDPNHQGGKMSLLSLWKQRDAGLESAQVRQLETTVREKRPPDASGVGFHPGSSHGARRAVKTVLQPSRTRPVGE